MLLTLIVDTITVPTKIMKEMLKAILGTGSKVGEFGGKGPFPPVEISVMKMRVFDARPDTQAITAMMNLLLRSPSIYPPEPMILATPNFKHLAIPRPADKKEVENVIQKSVSLIPSIS